MTSRGRAGVVISTLGLLPILIACQRAPQGHQSPATGSPVPLVTIGQLSTTEDGQWLMAAKDYANTRYSGLQEITSDNVSSLRPVWTFSTGVLRAQEAAPLVVNSTMFVVTPYPNVLYALDLAQSGAPLKWTYKPKPLAAAIGVACCDSVNRGAAYSDGKIFFNTLDNHTIAVDAESGREVWKTTVGEINLGETLTMAPIVVKGKVNASQGIDLKTGRPMMVGEKKPVTGKVIRNICPAAPGAKDWQPTSYSPQTGLLYIPHQNLCQDIEALDVGYIAGTPYVGANVKMYAGPGLLMWVPASLVFLVGGLTFLLAWIRESERRSQC